METGVSPRTWKPPSNPPQPSSTPPPPCSCYADWLGQREFRNRLLRAQEGKAKQARGNAIERLGKNVIGFRTAMKTESIFPFVCFGDGCDFSDDSSIIDRVVTIAQFGRLNVEHLHDQGVNNVFDRGTFYFRVEEWTEDEMMQLSLSVAEKSIY
ncbi:EcoRI family type II restriction endonuclease [Novosphingobium lubricantis]